MNTSNPIRDLWANGRPAVAGWCSTGNPYVAEMMANIGLDALVIDWQHGIGVSEASVSACIQAIDRTATVPMVRVPKNDPYYIQTVLDAGAFGVIVPMVNSAEEAELAGKSCRYVPRGNRSITMSRPAQYLGQQSYIDASNNDIICLVMIETQAALDNIQSITRVPEIDGVYIGPGDLSLDMGIGLTDWPTSDVHLEACQAVLGATKRAGLIPCHHGGNPSNSARLIKMGFMFCTICTDLQMLSTASASALTAFHKSLKEP